MLNRFRNTVIGYARYGVCIVLLATSQLVFASTLTTKNYIVTITANCAEGDVTCEDVTYHGVSRRSGKGITLAGKSIHTLCADGVTPCRFLGYEFLNGDVAYRVYESGLLEVTRGENEVLVEEQGEWTY